MYSLLIGLRLEPTTFPTEDSALRLTPDMERPFLNTSITTTSTLTSTPNHKRLVALLLHLMENSYPRVSTLEPRDSD